MHPKLEWSERQMGRRRSPRFEEDAGEGGEGGVGEGQGGDAGVNPHARGRRNVDLKPPKSPFDLLKTQDPLRWRQWYLGAGEGMFLNVTGLWSQGVRGGGVSVAILDDGVELTHLDLALNYDPAASWDLLDADPDPTPVPWSRHGTQLAGIAAALSYERDHVDVYLAAWGPVDTGAVMEGPGGLADRAMRESIVLGRKGRGSIYIWASGNGGFVGDDCNADGYANSMYTLTVSGSTRDGRPPDYAETCAAAFVSTYSGDADPEYEPGERVNGIVTTDTGGECTESFRGSSVSAAMVAGACALALDANPELGWRDMQHLMVQAATPHNPLPEHWKTNGVGRMYSHYFGFGSLDAGKMVALGRTWKPVPPSFRCLAQAPHHNITLVPDHVYILPLTVSSCQVVQAEHVQVNITISSDNRGQLELDLESPLGTTSKLLPKRPLDVSPYGINRHPFLSVHMWGENPRGTWKLRVVFHKSNILEPFGKKLFVDVPNMVLNWSLVVHGTEVPRRALPLQQNAAGRGSEGTEDPASASRRQEAARKGGKPHSFLLCKVVSSSPARVTSITWHDASGGVPRDVIKRLTGRGALGDKYPALLLVKETDDFKGNFTCRVVCDGKVFTKSIDVLSNLSSVPLAMETTQVALEGADAELPCHGLLPRGTWTRNGSRVKTSGRFTVAEDHLAIATVQEGDVGVYECHTRAPVLRYAHTARVTLLLANGTSTLITHYAITTQPQPTVMPTPPLCTRPQEELEEEEEDQGPPDCPRPYVLVGKHCVMVAEGSLAQGAGPVPPPAGRPGQGARRRVHAGTHPVPASQSVRSLHSSGYALLKGLSPWPPCLLPLLSAQTMCPPHLLR
ncbi:Furin-like protease 1, isoforms 1/1-X/2 [Penaeus vannamei]|uniref:Furin-like protease 1, isoforms 1/1-X/2 n=1 Tax=Penaeus vannamei TaxID=6689 RepID=A0A423TXB7_PENVA|nr:Furin-like protease 1, isoforms 1/1-X/2 [Penaeus vannamei]